MTTYDWINLLSNWSHVLLTSPLARHVPTGIIRNGWLGYAPAEAATLLQAEQRLQCNLPPTYREFLQVSNGWGLYTANMQRLVPIEQVTWTKVGRRPALLLSEGDGPNAILLDATVVNGVGEWQALYVDESTTPQTYPNFWELMQGWLRQLKAAVADTGERAVLTLEAVTRSIEYLYQQSSMMERTFHQRSMSPERQARAQQAVMMLNLLTSRLEAVRGQAGERGDLARHVQSILRESEQTSFHLGNEDFLQILGQVRAMLG